MKQQSTKMHTGIYIGTVALLVLFAGSLAWATIQNGQIELKKDGSDQTQDQAQTPTQPAPMDPFRDMLRLQQEMDQLFGNALNPYIGAPEFDAIWDRRPLQPAMDMREQPDAYTVQMDLPGVDKSEIKIEIGDHVLTVGAERKTSAEQDNDKGKVLVQERGMSSFSRQVVLPKSVNADQVTAEYKNGILTVTLPKNEKDQAARQIEIK